MIDAFSIRLFGLIIFLFLTPISIIIVKPSKKEITAAILASILFVFLDWVWEYAMITTQIWICQGEGPIGFLLGVPIIMLIQFGFLGIFLTQLIIIGEQMDWFTAASPRKQLAFRLGFQIIFSLIATIGEFVWRDYSVTIFEDWVFWIIWGAWFSLVATLVWSFLLFQKLLENSQ